MKWANAIARFSMGASGGLLDHFTKGGISKRNWNRILNAHCVTNGRTTQLLDLLTRLIRPPRPRKDVDGLLGHFTVAEQDGIINTLRDDGFYIFPQRLSEDLCDKIQAFASSAGTVTESNPDLSKPLVQFDPSHPISPTYKIREADSIASPVVQELMADPAFISIAEGYLNTHPTIGGVDIWWSTRYGNAPSSYAAQLFHFDFDAPPAWLKLFVYVTDVGPDGGPHVYVKGSHKAGIASAKEFRGRGYERVDDDEMVAAFGRDALVEITGTRGTVFVADTRGFHKGKMPTMGNRLVLQFLLCSPLFNDREAGAKLPLSLEPSLASAIAATPRVYDRFMRS